MTTTGGRPDDTPAETAARRVAKGVLADLSITGWEVGSVTVGTGRADRGAEQEPNVLVGLRPVAARRPLLLAFLPLDVPVAHACAVLAGHILDGGLREGLTVGLRCPTGAHVLVATVSGDRAVWSCPCAPDGERPVTGCP